MHAGLVLLTCFYLTFVLYIYISWSLVNSAAVFIQTYSLFKLHALLQQVCFLSSFRVILTHIWLETVLFALLVKNSRISFWNRFLMRDKVEMLVSWKKVRNIFWLWMRWSFIILPVYVYLYPHPACWHSVSACQWWPLTSVDIVSPFILPHPCVILAWFLLSKAHHTCSICSGTYRCCR